MRFIITEIRQALDVYRLDDLVQVELVLDRGVRIHCTGTREALEGILGSPEDSSVLKVPHQLIHDVSVSLPGSGDAEREDRSEAPDNAPARPK